MSYKVVVMEELEDAPSTAVPCLIVDSEERAEEVCLQKESESPGIIFWYIVCEEE